jgi:hypothetical protein
LPHPPAHEVLKQALLVAGADALAASAPSRSDPAFLARLPLVNSGLLTPDRMTHPLARTLYRNRSFYPRPISQPQEATVEPQSRIGGTAILGGVASAHFGHLLTQSLGRMWAAALAPEAPILFLPESAGFTALPDYFIELVRSFGIRNDLRLLHRTTHCDRLILPQDICNLMHRPAASPWFRAWLETRRPILPGVDSSALVYASRSNLGLQNGQYLQEAALEAALSSNGYRIYHPQDHTIQHQIETYASAQRLIFADGSAAHLWSFVARPEQNVAIILRRPRDRYFARWFRGLDCPPPAFIDCGLADFRRRGDGPARSITLLDLDAVWRELRTLGYHRDHRQIGPPCADLEAWIATLSPRFASLGSPPMPLDDLSLRLLAMRRHVAMRARPS